MNNEINARDVLKESFKILNDIKTKKGKKWIYPIFLTISILGSIFFPIPANAAVGDLILDTSILFSYTDPHEAATLGTTLLKEGYSLSLDDVYDICCKDRTAIGLTIYKNEDIVKTIKVKTGDYIYYNKTIGGREYAIIESKFDTYFSSVGDHIVLEPFYQYSDGSNNIEPDFVSTNLNPKTMEAPFEEWNRTFGGIYNNNVCSFQQTSDDGYILEGRIESQDPGDPEIYRKSPWFIKVDAKGNEIWNKTFGYFDPVLIKVDAEGNEIWHKTFKYSWYSPQQTSDGGFIQTGYPWLVKTDSNNIEQWKKSFLKSGPHSHEFSVRETPDGGYILIGNWLLKIDSNGNEQWNRIFVGAFDHIYAVQNTLDGGYILAGRTFSYGTGGDAWLLKTDANGNEEWNKTFGLDGFDSVYSVVQTSDGGYVLAGQIDIAKNPDFKGQILYKNYDAWLIKTDANGNLEWSKTFGGLKRDEANFVQETKDGGYVIAGTTESYGSGGTDIWLIKLSGDPERTGNISIASPTQTTTAVPHETSTIIPPEKASGFQFALAISILLAVYASRRKRM